MTEDPDTPANDSSGSLADFSDFANRLKAGEGTAAVELLGLYTARLVTLARCRLRGRLAVKADPEDILQSVFRTFYRRLSNGELELRDWEALSGLLSILTLRKCQRQAERNLSGKRDVRRETEMSLALEIPDRNPTPDEAAIFTDLLESLLNSLDTRDRQIVELLIAGESTNSIAERVGCSRRTVYRTVERLHERLIESSEF